MEKHRQITVEEINEFEDYLTEMPDDFELTRLIEYSKDNYDLD